MVGPSAKPCKAALCILVTSYNFVARAPVAYEIQQPSPGADLLPFQIVRNLH